MGGGQKYNNLWAFRAQYGIINSDRGGGSDLLPLPHSHGYRSTEQLFEQNLYFSHFFYHFHGLSLLRALL